MAFRVTYLLNSLQESWHVTEADAMTEVRKLVHDPDATDIRLWEGNPDDPRSHKELRLSPRTTTPEFPP